MFDQSSYQGELGGILASIKKVNQWCNENKILRGTCTLGCDNKGALNAAFGFKGPQPTWSSYDLVSMIRYQIKTSPIRWKHRHVKGHADDHSNYELLDTWSQANVRADKLAKEALDSEDDYDESFLLPGEPWRLHHKKATIRGDFINTIRKREIGRAHV